MANPVTNEAVGTVSITAKSTMSPALSVYLDLIRFLAAFAVFGAHFEYNLASTLWWRLGPAGAPAVAVFFVLSGFVISHVVQSRPTSALTYATDRMARMASVAFPALALTYILQGGVGRDFGADALVRSLTFTNQAWAQVPWGNNGPYWSLGFEVPYYAIFGAMTFLRRPWGSPAGLVLLALAGPKVAVLFPIWWLGYFTHWACSRVRVSDRVATVLLLAPLPLFVFGVPEPFSGAIEALTFDPARLLTVARDYYVGVAFSAHIVGFNALFGRLRVPAILGTTIRWLAGATFSLYLFHFPLIIAIKRIWPYPPSDWRSVVVAPCLVIAAVYVLAEFTERRKRVWQRAIRYCCDLPRTKRRPA